MAKRRKKSTPKAFEKKINYIIAAILVIASIIGSLLFPDLFSVSNGLPSEAAQASTKVHVIDVGQGDAVLLEDNGMFALIDSGEKSAQIELITYLEQAGVKQLEYLIMSHPHSDHYGAMGTVIEKINVKKVLFPQFDKAPLSTSSTFEKLLVNIQDNNIPSEIVNRGNIYPLGDAEIEILHEGIEDENQNNISTAILFKSDDLRFLSTGDAEKEVEKEILYQKINIKADIFKAAHHGSSTSNTNEFIKAIMPKAVLISCGADNPYGHPHKEAMKSFAEVNAKTYQTNINGTIIAYVNTQGGISIVSMQGE